MMTSKRILLALAAAVFILGAYAWPLHGRFSSGVPFTSSHGESHIERHMVMGDHIQLVYHFWLTSEWMWGGTPVGYNPYIFNQGDDEATKCTVTDYFPFSLTFAVLNGVFSRAASWNLTILFSIWVSFFFTARLLRNYGASDWTAGLLALAVVGLPYQWTMMFGGSPTGFAMMAVPMFLYGMEGVIRRGAFRAGIVAMLALLTAFWSDGHVLLFLLLLGPSWAVLTLIHEESFPWKSKKEWLLRVVAALPLLLTVLGSVYLRLKTKAAFSGTTVSAGREWFEIAIYSPTLKGLVAMGTSGLDHSVYLGVFFILMMMAGVWLAISAAIQNRRWRLLLHTVLLASGVVITIAFALGTNGPAEGVVLRAMRKLLPPIAMIRQPAKVFSLLVPMLAILSLPLWSYAAEKIRSTAGRRWLPVLLTVIVLADWIHHVRPGFCLFNDEQGAYAAVAHDAEARQEMPILLALPIWPGDSAWTSIYQHHASLYRMRMINGYLPVVSKEYIESIYFPLESVNTGVLFDDQIELLKSRGIHYIVFHEDAYPEQVSWFPVGFALKKLLSHPRLHFLAQDGSVWSFRILDKGESGSGHPLRAMTDSWNLFGSRIQSEMPNEVVSGGAEIREEDDGETRYVRLHRQGDTVGMRPFNHQHADHPMFFMRVRGRADWRMTVDSETRNDTFDYSTDSADWVWIKQPLSYDEASKTFRPTFHVRDGVLDVHRVMYVSGTPPTLAPGESYDIPAPALYHAGYTDLSENAVVFRTLFEPPLRILYGPRWVLPEGTYEARLVWALAPPPDVAAGTFDVQIGGKVAGVIAVVGDDEETLVFSTRGRELPIEFGFYYSREADVSLKSIRITRVD